MGGRLIPPRSRLGSDHELAKNLLVAEKTHVFPRTGHVFRLFSQTVCEVDTWELHQIECLFFVHSLAAGLASIAARSPGNRRKLF